MVHWLNAVIVGNHINAHENINADRAGFRDLTGLVDSFLAAKQ